MKDTKRNQKEKQWWLSLAYALGRLRGPLTTVRSLAPLETTRGFGMTPMEKYTLLFKLTHYQNRRKMAALLFC